MATSKLTINHSKKIVNIGLLVLKKYSGKKIGTEMVSRLSCLLDECLPEYGQQIGTSIKNIPMQRIALNNGFIEKETLNDNVMYFKSIDLGVVKKGLPDSLSEAKTVACFAHDAGGAQSVLNLITKLKKNKTLKIKFTGPAESFINRINSPFQLVSELADEYFDTLISGTGKYPGPEYNAMKLAKSRKKEYIAVLDHWVNYRARFGGLEKNFPKVLLTSNDSASDVARRVFYKSEIYQIERLEAQNKFDLKFHLNDRIILVLDKLDSYCFENMFPVTLELIRKLIGKIVSSFGTSRSVTIIAHPSETIEIQPSDLIENSKLRIEVIYGFNFNHFFGTKVVIIGFNSSLLYDFAQQGYSVRSVYKFHPLHWTFKHSNIFSTEGFVNEVL